MWTETTPHIHAATVARSSQGVVDGWEWRSRPLRAAVRYQGGPWVEVDLSRRRRGWLMSCPGCGRWAASLYWPEGDVAPGRCGTCCRLRPAWSEVSRGVSRLRATVRSGGADQVLEAAAAGDVAARIALEDEGLMPTSLRPEHGLLRRQRHLVAQVEGLVPGASTEAAVVSGSYLAGRGRPAVRNVRRRAGTFRED